MPFLDMQPTVPSDTERKFIMYKAAAGQGGSDSADGLTPATALATSNEWWQRITGMNNNGCWPWLYCLAGNHTDSLDACCPISGTPGLNLQGPTSGMGAFPVLTGAWTGNPSGGTFAQQRAGCVIKGGAGKVAFSSIWGANYVCTYFTLDVPGRNVFEAGEKGVISGGNHVVRNAKYVIEASGGSYIGDGGFEFEPGSYGGIWSASEGGEVKMVAGVPVVFQGATSFYGVTAIANNRGYIRCPVIFTGKSFVTGSQYICFRTSGIDTSSGNILTFLPGSGNALDATSWVG